MPRRRDTSAWNDDKLIELTALGPFVAPPRQCTRPEWCPKCRVDGFTCQSFFASEDERRDAYWRHRDEILSMDGCYGRRPWSFWRYEAAGLCECDEPCVVPPPADHDGKDAFMWRHDALTGEERTALQQFRVAAVVDGRLDDDDG